jgi:outer membrane protein assembly factor BamB
VRFPAQPAWKADLGQYTSYPLIVDGRVFVLGPAGEGMYGVYLYALDARTGHRIWGPVAVEGTYAMSNLAYDGGKVFVTNFNSVLRAYDAATGELAWARQLFRFGSGTSAPTAVNGTVYVGQEHGHIYAVDEATGEVRWTQTVKYGGFSSPAVSEDGVYVAYPCHYYRFSPGTGASIWERTLSCTAGGGRTPVVQGSRVFVRDDTTGPNGHVLDARTGTLLYSLWLGTIPALDDTNAYAVTNGIATAIEIGSGREVWSFTADTELVTQPIVIDDYVIVAAATGNVYALDASTGAQVWRGHAGATIPESEPFLAVPLSGMASAEHMLIVATDKGLTAWSLDGT